MAKKYRVSVDAVRKAQAAMVAEHTKMKNVLAELDAMSKTLMTTWEGEASTTYDGKYKGLQPALDSYQMKALKYANGLEAVGNTYGTQEMRATSDVSNLKTPPIRG